MPARCFYWASCGRGRDAWPFGSYRQITTLIMSDSLGRLHKIIITQQWSELPHWHFHTTSDLCSDLRGHDQGQGSGRAPLISQHTQSLLPLPPRLYILPCVFPPFFYFPHHLCVCLSHTLIFTSRAQLSHPFSSVCEKGNEEINREYLRVPSKK